MPQTGQSANVPEWVGAVLKILGTLLALAAVSMLGMVGWYINGISNDVALLRAEQRELMLSMVKLQSDVALLKVAVEDISGGNTFSSMDLSADRDARRGHE